MKRLLDEKGWNSKPTDGSTVGQKHFGRMKSYQSLRITGHKVYRLPRFGCICLQCAVRPGRLSSGSMAARRDSNVPSGDALLQPPRLLCTLTNTACRHPLSMTAGRCLLPQHPLKSHDLRSQPVRVWHAALARHVSLVSRKFQ